MTNQTELHCSFCGKESSEVNQIIAGDSGCICNECIELCHNLIKTDDTSSEQSGIKNSLDSSAEQEVTEKMSLNYQLHIKLELI